MRFLLIATAIAFSFFALGEETPKSLQSQPQKQQHSETTKNQCSPNISVQCQPRQASENKGDNAASHAPPAHAGTGTNNEKRIADGTENLVIATWCLGVFTLALFGATWLLFRDAKETSRAQLRAYVNTTTLDIGNVADPVYDPKRPIDRKNLPASIQNPDSGPYALTWIINSGKTPALDVVHWGDMVFDTYPTPQNKLETDGKDALTLATVLNPDVKASKSYKIQKTLTTAEIESLRRGTSAIYVYGIISYKDVFGERHFSKYRFMYHPSGSAGNIGYHSHLSTCDGGNDTDRDYQKTKTYRLKKWIRGKLT